MLPILKPRSTDLRELMEIQRRVSQMVRVENGFGKLERVAGCDVSFARGERAWAACVVMDYRTLEVLEERVRPVKLRFPYIPTFLAFRELEGILEVVRGVEADVFMVGAQGLAHPRRAGLACHLGVVIDRSTVGVAKSKLVGEGRMPADRAGAWEPLVDGGEVVGAIVRTVPGQRPVYVSVGHRVTLESAVRIALETCRGRRLPEPILAAHERATEAMEGGR
jgi:deoxyribonuclease V